MVEEFKTIIIKIRIMKIVSVISKTNLDVTFEGVACLLRRTKTKISEQGGITTLTVLTDRVSFQEVKTPIYTDEEIMDGEIPTGEFEPLLDDDGNQVMKTETKLVSHSVRDSKGVGRLTEEQVNELAEMTKPLIPEDATETERRQMQEVQGLLYLTVNEKVYGTDKWQIYEGDESSI